MIAWIDSVKQTGKLDVYLGALAGTWAQVLREALHDFNLLSKGHKLASSWLPNPKSRPTTKAAPTCPCKPRTAQLPPPTMATPRNSLLAGGSAWADFAILARPRQSIGKSVHLLANQASQEHSLRASRWPGSHEEGHRGARALSRVRAGKLRSLDRSLSSQSRRCLRKHARRRQGLSGPGRPGMPPIPYWMAPRRKRSKTCGRK